MKLAKSVALALMLVGCAAANGPTAGDGSTGGHAICPDHPEQCGGQCCGNICIDTMNDIRNCGGCGSACASGQLCQAGSCGCLPSGALCGTGQTCCSASGCKSLMSDAFNCGTCGNKCGPGGTCVGGQCKCGSSTCAAGQSCCNGTCAASCVTDMGTALDLSSSSGLCMCSSHCPLTMLCVGPDCCYEDALFGTCMPSTTCQFNQNP